MFFAMSRSMLLSQVLLISIFFLIEIHAERYETAYVTTENTCLNFDYNYTIKSFLNYPSEIDDYVYSPLFVTKDIGYGVKLKVNAIVYPCGTENNKNDVGVFLAFRIEPSNAVPVLTSSYSIVLPSKKNGYEDIKIKLESKIFKPGDSGYGSTRLTTLNHLRSHESVYLPDGHLTLKFTGIACWIVNRPVSRSLNSADLATNMIDHLYFDETASDLVIKASDSTVKAHKAILLLRSKYFKARIESETALSTCNETVLDVSDIMNGQELRDLMAYLYLGETSNLNVTCRTLFKVAGQFGLTELRELSETALIGQLNLENAWELLHYAYENMAKRLKKEAALMVAKINDNDIEDY